MKYKILRLFLRWIDAWCNLIDSIICIITCGIICTDLSYKFTIKCYKVLKNLKTKK